MSSATRQKGRDYGHLAFYNTSVLGQGEATELAIENVSAPGQQPPNASVPVDITISNSALSLVGDPDQCDPGLPGGKGGLLVEVTLSRGDVFQDRTEVCVPGGTLLGGPGRETVTLSFDAPDQPGEEIDFTVDAVTAREGQHVGQESGSVTISEEARAAPECSTNADCPGNQICSGGQCVSPDQAGVFRPFLCLLNPLRSCTTAEVVTMAGSGLFTMLLLFLAAF